MLAGVLAGASAYAARGWPVGDPATATDLLTATAASRARLDRATASAATHLSHATGLLIEVLGANDGLRANLIQRLNPTTLFLSMLARDPLDRLLPLGSQG